MNIYKYIFSLYIYIDNKSDNIYVLIYIFI